MEMFAGCYEFDSLGMACWFGRVKGKQEAPKMLGLIQKITDRLNEINDSSFVIEDCETERLKSL